MQSRYVTSVFTSNAPALPPARAMHLVISRERRYFPVDERYGLDNGHMGSLSVRYPAYCDDLARRIGCYPSASDVFWRYGFRAWRDHVFGPLSPCQYRLFGRHS